METPETYEAARQPTAQADAEAWVAAFARIAAILNDREAQSPFRVGPLLNVERMEGRDSTGRWYFDLTIAQVRAGLTLKAMD